MMSKSCSLRLAWCLRQLSHCPRRTQVERRRLLRVLRLASAVRWVAVSFSHGHGGRQNHTGGPQRDARLRHARQPFGCLSCVRNNEQRCSQGLLFFFGISHIRNRKLALPKVLDVLRLGKTILMVKDFVWPIQEVRNQSPVGGPLQTVSWSIKYMATLKVECQSLSQQ